MSEAIPSEQFMRAVNYDPVTGKFSRVKKGRDGTPRFHIYPAVPGNNGYVRIVAFGQRFYGHRLAWFYTHGYMPPNEIDHINCDKGDNSIGNLRLATRAQNGTNRARTGACLRGVTKSKGKYVAQIKVNGTHIHLGTFPAEVEAHEAFKAAAFAARGEFARVD